MGEIMVRGIRGAVQAESNTQEAIEKATTELLKALVEANDIKIENIASVILSTTHDLNAAFPAQAARKLGWTLVPLMCTREIDVPNSMPSLIRVLIHVNTDKTQEEIKHIYLGAAAALRPDLAGRACEKKDGQKS